jgi:nicotinamidase-related amidase
MDSSLTSASKSVLIIIDVQKEFLEKIDKAPIHGEENHGAMVKRIGWVTNVAEKQR